MIEAARLCAAAEGGQILAADLVRLTARGRGGHTFAPVGPIALKGLPEPVVACAVAWETLGHVGLPLPPRLGTRPAFAMFGRGAEAEALALAWAKAKDGQRQVVLVAGEPGIGKTRLAAEAARAAHADGGTVLFGACDEDVGLPYRPFVEALRHYVTHAPDDVLAAHVRTHRGELTRLVPELGRRIAALPAPQIAEAETERFLLFEAVTGLLAAASRERPLVLVLDDLHWAGRTGAAALEASGPLGRADAAPGDRHVPRHRPLAHPSTDPDAGRSAARGRGRAPVAARARRCRG